MKTAAHPPSAHEVFRVVSESASMMFSGGELKTKEADTSAGFAVRALVDGRLGFAYCQEEHELKKTLDAAAKASHYSEKTKFSFAPKAHYIIPDSYDEALQPDDYPALRGMVEEARSAAESRGGKARIMLSAERGAVELRNSEGFSGSYRKTDFSIYAECMHGDGYGFAYLSSCKRPKEVHSVGQKAADMAKAMHGATKPESGTHTVVFELSVLAELFDILMPSFSGDWKRRKMTKLQRDRKAFSEKFTLCEDGFAHASALRPFDDEGTPSKRRILVERGFVKSFLYDRETAALEGTNASGACARGSYDSPPSLSSSNLVVSPGTWESVSELGKHIELHSAHGSHTANVTTGDFGMEASVAFLVDGAKRTPLKGFMVTGNIFELFANVEAMERKQQVHDSLISPRIAFRDVRIVS